MNMKDQMKLFSVMQTELAHIDADLSNSPSQEQDYFIQGKLAAIQTIALRMFPLGTYQQLFKPEHLR